MGDDSKVDPNKAELNEEELSKVSGGFLGSLFAKAEAAAGSGKGGSTSGGVSESLSLNFTKITY